MAAIGLGISALGASANKKAAQKSMNAQAELDQATRVSSAKAMIAQTTSQNVKVEELTRVGDIMQMQGKAESLMRKERYNDTQAMAMVMGAASGRVFGEGSVDIIMDKSNSDFMWDQMWAANNETISMAALEQDKANIYRAGKESLLLGKDQLSLSRKSSMLGQENQAAAAQQAFNNTMMSAGQSLTSNYGGSLVTKGKSLFERIS